MQRKLDLQYPMVSVEFCLDRGFFAVYENGERVGPWKSAAEAIRRCGPIGFVADPSRRDCAQ